MPASYLSEFWSTVTVSVLNVLASFPIYTDTEQWRRNVSALYVCACVLWLLFVVVFMSCVCLHVVWLHVCVCAWCGCVLTAWNVLASKTTIAALCMYGRQPSNVIHHFTVQGTCFTEKVSCG